MSVHQKHEALDQIVHWLLALTMWACAISILMEVAWRHSVLPSAARSLSCIMQGMWLIQVCFAHTMACGHYCYFMLAQLKLFQDVHLVLYRTSYPFLGGLVSSYTDVGCRLATSYSQELCLGWLMRAKPALCWHPSYLPCLSSWELLSCLGSTVLHRQGIHSTFDQSIHSVGKAYSMQEGRELKYTEGLDGNHQHCKGLWTPCEWLLTVISHTASNLP